MARYARVFSTIWSADGDFRALSMGAQWQYLMLISQPDISHCGVLPLTERRWATLAVDTDADSVTSFLTQLDTGRFIRTDPSTEELWVRTYMKWDGQYTSPNGVKAIQKAVAEILSHPLRSAVNDAVRSLLEAPPQGATEAPPQGATESAVEGATEPQQPAASGQQPRPAAAAEAPPAGDQGAAAAAMDLLIEYRLNTEHGIRSITKYSDKIRHDETEAYGQKMTALAADGQTPRQIIEAIYGISQANLARHTNGRRAS